jgi:hypothetical protein
MRRAGRIAALLLVFVAGFACGGYAFVDTQARSLPGVHQCLGRERCLTDPQVLGLLGSVGLHAAPGWMPGTVEQSPECVGIDSPWPEARIDYVFIPRHDVRNILELGVEDQGEVMACFALMRKLVQERGIAKWRVVTNGPGYQTVDYLHFHLLAD